MQPETIGVSMTWIEPPTWKNGCGLKNRSDFGQFQHLAAALGAAQHCRLKQHRALGHRGGAGGELNHRDVIGSDFAAA